jgi:hypothetical protein
MLRMDTPSKRRPAAKSAQSTKLAPAPAGSSAKPFLRFYHSEALRKRTLVILTSLESARDPTVHRGALADIAVELTNGGLDYYFIQPLKVARAGFIVEQSAGLGMTGVQQLMGSVIRNVIGRMDGPQLLSVGQSLRQFMR